MGKKLAILNESPIIRGIFDEQMRYGEALQGKRYHLVKVQFNQGTT